MSGERTTQRRAFRQRHDEGCFVMPNPWDAGSARYLATLGFPALATTSAGMAFSLGMADGDAALTLDAVLDHIAAIVAATELPVNADFESGHAADLEGVAANVTRCVAAGAAGLSIEDSTGDRDAPLRSIEESVERIRAARDAIDATGEDVMLTGRAECHLVGHPDPLAESVRRLQAYAEAGADVLYAPGPADHASIRTIVEAVAPKPVNVLALANSPTVGELADLGVRRISVGSALARAAWAGLQAAAEPIASIGSFDGLAAGASGADLNRLLRGGPPTTGSP